MATLFDNLVVQQTVSGDALVADNWYNAEVLVNRK